MVLLHINGVGSFMSEANRFEQYLGDIYKYHEDLVEQERIREKDLESELQRKDSLRRLNEQRKQSHEGHKPVDLWGQEAAELCSEFIQYAVKASGSRRNLIGATYLRGEDPVEEYLEYKGIFRNKPVVKTRVSGVGWRMSGYPIAYSSKPQVRTDIITGSQHNDLVIPDPDIFLCRDGLIRHDGHLIYLNINGDLKMPVFPSWRKTTKVHKESYSGGSGSTFYKNVYTHTLQFSKLKVMTGLEQRLKELTLRINDGVIKDEPDQF